VLGQRNMSELNAKSLRSVWWRRSAYVAVVFGVSNIIVGGTSHLIVGGSFLIAGALLELRART
jgi:hypothetical protein